jgi:hypothetical protein
MLRLMDRVLRTAFVLAVASSLAIGAQAAFAAERASGCLCDPDDPGANEFCASDRCCDAAGSVCPLGGSGLRECLCA